MDIDRAVEKMVRDVRYALYQIVVLRLLVEKGPLHGYGIRKLIHDMSRGALNPSESTIYDILKRLEKLGLVESFWGESPFGGPMRKYYRAKEEARKVLEILVYEVRKLIDIALGACYE